MKILKPIKSILFLSAFLMTALVKAQVYNVNTSGTIISGAVDANGKPTQTLTQLFPGFNVVRVNAATVTIQNVIIDASNRNIGIEINNQANVTINNVVVRNARENGILAVNTTNLRISNSVVYSNGLSQDVSIATWVGIPDGYGVYNGNGVPINYAGIYINGNGNRDVLIEGNNVYGNIGHGIKLEGVTTDGNGDGYSAILRKNIIGFNNTTKKADGNLADGIQLTNSQKVLIDGNQSVANGNRRLWNAALGDIAKDQNSGLDNENFYGAGIELKNSSTNTIINNLVGTDSSGTKTVSGFGVSLGNNKHGIYIRNGSKNNIIGSPNNGNIVGGNGFAFQDVHTNDSNPLTPLFLFGVAHGITLHDDGGVTSGNKVQGNFVGYYKGSCIPNRQDGISLLGFYSGGTSNGLRDNIIGGTTAGTGNVIGGGMFGIFAQGTEVGPNTIQGNFIGTDGPALNNINCSPSEGGIVLQNGADQLTVGGSVAGAGNYIANIPAGFPAIAVKGSTSTKNVILNNVMSCNGGGIKLATGGNLEFGVSAPNQLAVNTLGSDSKAITGITPNLNDKIDVYIADSCAASAKPCQAVGGDATKAQGLKYITTITPVQNTTLTTRTEKGYFSFDLTSAIAVSNGLKLDNVIFAARDINNNTSEFHKCIAIALCSPPALVDIVTPTTLNLCSGSSATITAQITKATGDNAPLSDFRYILYSMPAQTKVAENATGTFNVATAGTYKVFAYNIVDQTKCGKLSDKSVVVAFEAPVAPAVISQTTPGKLCVNQANVQFSVTGKSGSSYKWSISNDPTWSATGATVTLAKVTGNFTISVIETTAAPFSCPQAPVSLAVVVNPLPNVEVITGKQEVCAGETAIYTVPLKAGYTYVWSTNATDAVLTQNANSVSIKWGSISGTISLAITNENGCKASSPSTLAVIVNTLPLAKSITGENPVCAGSLQNYSVPATSGSTFEWKVGGVVNASITNQLSITIPEVTSLLLEVLETSNKGCKALAPASMTVAVNKRPVPFNLKALPSPDVCIGKEYSVSVDLEKDVVFNWSSAPSSMIPTNSTSNILNLTGIESGVITVSAKNSVTGCVSNSSEVKKININVRPLPTKPVIVGKETVACSATEVYSVQNPITTSKYIWYYGIDAIGDPLEGELTTKSSTTVKFGKKRAEVEVKEISQYGCESALGVINPVMVGCDPAANFKVDAPSYCLGTPVKVQEFATYTPANILPVDMWFYFIGADVDSLKVLPGGFVTVNYLAPGTYPVKMKVIQAGQTAIKDSIGVVVIKPLATIASSSLIGSTKICQNFEGTYSIDKPNTGSTYTWSFPGAVELAGSTNLSKKLKFGPSSEDVTITVNEDRNGCLGTLTQVIDVLPSPKKLSVAGLKSVCQNEEFVLTLINAPSTSTFVWTPGANIISYNTNKSEATLKFAAAGDYTFDILETDINGCFAVDSISKVSVNVKALPANPVIQGDGLKGVCDGAEASFTSPLIAGYVYNWSVVSPDVIKTKLENNVVVKPSGVGEKTISLQLDNKGCKSEIVTAKYNVEANPSAPVINPVGPNFCEAAEVKFSVSSPKSTSTYCWVIPSGSSLTSGALCGLSKDEITVKLGTTGGKVEVSEVTALGCKSTANGTANVVIQKLLGAENIIKFYTGEICSNLSNDSLAQYEIEVPNATSVKYTISPSLVATAFKAVDGVNSAKLDVVFPSTSEEKSYEVTATAKAGSCDTKTIKWNVGVLKSEDIDVSIDVRDVCEGDKVVYTAILSSNRDVNPEFTWYLNNKVKATGKTITIADIRNGDDLRVEYKQGGGFCADIVNSNLIQIEKIIAFEKPEVDLMIKGNGVNENFDNFNNKYYQINGKQIIELEAELLIKQESNANYNYVFSWKNGNSRSYLNITKPIGKFGNSDIVTTEANQNDLQNGLKERWYVVETNVNDICFAKDSVRLVIDYVPWIPNVLNPNCGCADAVWRIDNIEQFPNNTVVIYNRWGSVVKTYGPGEFTVWDGRGDDGKELPVGTYFYTVNLDGKNAICTGPVTLLR